MQFLAQRKADLTEWMDRSDCDAEKLHNTYRYFPVINRLISQWYGIYKQFIRPRLSREQSFSLLDVGSGGGDIPAKIFNWARNDGFLLDVTGIDPDPRAHKYAQSYITAPLRNTNRPHSTSRPDSGLQYRKMYTTDLLEEGARFDFVTCNHVLHHLSDSEIHPFLLELKQLAANRVICSDIERSRIGYFLFSIFTRPFFPNSYIRADGLISIRKSYTFTELRDLLDESWTVQRQFPFRLVAICDITATAISATPTTAT